MARKLYVSTKDESPDMFETRWLNYFSLVHCTHYASHHTKITTGILGAIKKHHMRHHYQDPDSGFGFTSKLWDKVFGTDFNLGK